MHTYRLIVGPDGTLQVPDAVPGQVVTVVVEPVPSATPDREPLTLATAKTPEERAEVMDELKRLASQIRESLRDEVNFTIEDLYGDDGLPA
ncbi:MAG: hypothetical protein QM589_07960 [Thermomicrobiales bacterium]